MLTVIFLGQITRWNDPALTALNLGLSLPDAAITVVHHHHHCPVTGISARYDASDLGGPS